MDKMGGLRLITSSPSTFKFGESTDVQIKEVKGKPASSIFVQRGGAE
jgi:hypothetical protein